MKEKMEEKLRRMLQFQKLYSSAMTCSVYPSLPGLVPAIPNYLLENATENAKHNARSLNPACMNQSVETVERAGGFKGTTEFFDF
jgi:hypothetical protein